MNKQEFEKQIKRLREDFERQIERLREDFEASQKQQSFQWPDTTHWPKPNTRPIGVGDAPGWLDPFNPWHPYKVTCTTASTNTVFKSSEAKPLPHPDKLAELKGLCARAETAQDYLKYNQELLRYRKFLNEGSQ